MNSIIISTAQYCLTSLPSIFVGVWGGAYMSAHDPGGGDPGHEAMVIVHIQHTVVHLFGGESKIELHSKGLE